jgi:hypothetical protein
MWWESRTERQYARDLPGAGFVAIDVRAGRSLLHGKQFLGTLVLERRERSRRDGHAPPVVAEVSGPTVEAVLRQLLPTAQSNAALGAALLRRQPIIA